MASDITTKSKKEKLIAGEPFIHSIFGDSYAYHMFYIKPNDKPDNTSICSCGVLGHHIANVSKLTDDYISLYTYWCGKKIKTRLKIEDMDFDIKINDWGFITKDKK